MVRVLALDRTSLRSHFDRTMDVVALSIIAGKERSRKDWEMVVSSVGGGLQLLNIHGDVQGAFGVVELGLEPVDRRSDGKT